MSWKACCLEESERSLRKHRDVATCDACGALLLAYDNELDFSRTVEELTDHGVEFDTRERGGLKLVVKTR